MLLLTQHYIIKNKKSNFLPSSVPYVVMTWSKEWNDAKLPAVTDRSKFDHPKVKFLGQTPTEKNTLVGISEHPEAVSSKLVLTIPTNEGRRLKELLKGSLASVFGENNCVLKEFEHVVMANLYGELNFNEVVHLRSVMRIFKLRVGFRHLHIEKDEKWTPSNNIYNIFVEVEMPDTMDQFLQEVFASTGDGQFFYSAITVWQLGTLTTKKSFNFPPNAAAAKEKFQSLFKMPGFLTGQIQNCSFLMDHEGTITSLPVCPLAESVGIMTVEENNEFWRLLRLSGETVASEETTTAVFYRAKATVRQRREKEKLTVKKETKKKKKTLGSTVKVKVGTLPPEAEDQLEEETEMLSHAAPGAFNETLYNIEQNKLADLKKKQEAVQLNLAKKRSQAEHDLTEHPDMDEKRAGEMLRQLGEAENLEKQTRDAMSRQLEVIKKYEENHPPPAHLSYQPQPPVNVWNQVSTRKIKKSKRGRGQTMPLESFQQNDELYLTAAGGGTDQSNVDMLRSKLKVNAQVHQHSTPGASGAPKPEFHLTQANDQDEVQILEQSAVDVGQDSESDESLHLSKLNLNEEDQRAIPGEQCVCGQGYRGSGAESGPLTASQLEYQSTPGLHCCCDTERWCDGVMQRGQCEARTAAASTITAAVTTSTAPVSTLTTPSVNTTAVAGVTSPTSVSQDTVTGTTNTYSSVVQGATKSPVAGAQSPGQTVITSPMVTLKPRRTKDLRSPQAPGDSTIKSDGTADSTLETPGSRPLNLRPLGQGQKNSFENAWMRRK